LAKVTNTVEEVTEVTLTLSREEAEVVAWLFGGISGSSQPRNVTSAIWSRLMAAGIGYGDLKEKWIRPVIGFKEKIPGFTSAIGKIPKCGVFGCGTSACNPDPSYKNYFGVAVSYSANNTTITY
jgi:hypothetical protein